MVEGRREEGRAGGAGRREEAKGGRKEEEERGWEGEGEEDTEGRRQEEGWRNQERR